MRTMIAIPIIRLGSLMSIWALLAHMRARVMSRIVINMDIHMKRRIGIPMLILTLKEKNGGQLGTPVMTREL
jgi:hypothetical protein